MAYADNVCKRARMKRRNQAIKCVVRRAGANLRHINRVMSAGVFGIEPSPK